MKTYKIVVIVLLLGFTKIVSAQNKRFPNEGIITFEKKVNMYAIIKAQIKKNPTASYLTMAFEDYQKKQPQFKTLKSTLSFSKGQTLFTPIEDESMSNAFFGEIGAAQQNNIIASNTITKTSISQKKVYEELYLVNDSARKINWKITSEVRNIAGYECRRANAIIMDSIYVVAFYTDLIPVSGGPESFAGLPGMILGVALPYEHTTWFATTVLDQPVADNKLKAPVKGKPLTNAGLISTLKTALKNWGSYAQEALKEFLL